MKEPMQGPKRASVPAGCNAMLTVVSRSAAALVLAAGLGCYTYRPMPSPQLPVGARVSVQLTDDGARELGGMIGPNIEHVEGDLLEADSTALQLSVRQVENQRGISNNWNGERVRIPRRDVVGVQQRRLSVGGSALLGGIGAAAMYLLYSAISGNGLFEGSSGSGNPSPQH